MITRCSRLAALLALALAAGCTRDNPAVCESNTDCSDKAKAGQVPSTDLLCHPLDRLCYAGCATDQDCQKPGLRPGQRCDLPTRQCLPVATDGGLGDGAGRGDARGTQGLGTACGGAGVCASGFCVDGRCCESACGGLCERCDISGALGACSAVPAGQDPGTECAPGTTASDALCAGTCDGARRCRFDTSKVCDGACRTVAGSGDTTALSFRCGDDGRCNLSTAATTKLCQFSRCTGSGPSADCPVSCTTAADCLATSLCDRAEAHASGKGACVNPAQVLRLTDATTDANLNTALGQLSEAKPYLGLRPGTYTLGATLSGKRAVLIGLGAKPEDVTLRPSAAPALSVGPSATLQLQNLALVRPAGSPVVGDALTCSADATHRSSVTVLESILAGHADQGLEASYCEVTVRRSTLHDNDGGGLKLTDRPLHRQRHPPLRQRHRRRGRLPRGRRELRQHHRRHLPQQHRRQQPRRRRHGRRRPLLDRHHPARQQHRRRQLPQRLRLHRRPLQPRRRQPRRRLRPHRLQAHHRRLPQRQGRQRRRRPEPPRPRQRPPHQGRQGRPRRLRGPMSVPRPPSVERRP
ncbi:MAG: hypothetical protein IPG96_03920 [Proteobacteria bacterium]|nr:hypothetical protein [Pseudomonadota bacterium]